LGEAPDAIFLNCFKRFSECDFVRKQVIPYGRGSVFGNDLKRVIKAANANVNAYAAFFNDTRKGRFDNLKFCHS